MLDRKFIVDNADAVKQNCQNRGVAVDIDGFMALENRRKEIMPQVEDLNRQANEVSKTIGKAKDAAEREARKNEGRQLREQTTAKQAELDQVLADMETFQRSIPNMTHPAAPLGGEADSVEVKQGRTPVKSLDFKPLDHVELNERLDLFDLEAGGRVAGHGFYYMKNDGVRLELALQQYAMDVLSAAGFTPIITPDLALDKILDGIGFIPRGPETQIYSIANTDLSLVATAEITLGGMYADQTFDAEQLPLKFCGLSHCFRTEAGAHGKATRGLFRVHQFTKVEMFAFTTPEASDAAHEEILQLECQLFDNLGIPYRVIDTATGDLGGPAYRKYDLEAWMPGRGTAGEYAEVTSTSNCTDYQARRLNCRYRRKGEKGTQFLHTLNGTAFAIGRTIIAILENYQQADGSVVVPEVLRKWLGKDLIVPKR